MDEKERYHMEFYTLAGIMAVGALINLGAALNGGDASTWVTLVVLTFAGIALAAYGRYEQVKARQEMHYRDY